MGKTQFSFLSYDGRGSGIKRYCDVSSFSLFLNNISFEQDNMELISNCNGAEGRWQISTLPNDILQCSTQVQEASFVWVPCCINQVAHWIATYQLKGSLLPQWSYNPPAQPGSSQQDNLFWELAYFLLFFNVFSFGVRLFSGSKAGGFCLASVSLLGQICISLLGFVLSFPIKPSPEKKNKNKNKKKIQIPPE